MRQKNNDIIIIIIIIIIIKDTTTNNNNRKRELNKKMLSLKQIYSQWIKVSCNFLNFEILKKK